MKSKFKCDKCECRFKKEVTLKEHKNTRHPEPNSFEGKELHKGKFGHGPGVTPDEEMVTETIEACDMNETEEIEGIEDLFQIEIVEGKELYACNVCNEGFEKNDEIKKHIEKDHYQVVLQIRKEMYEDKEDGSDGIIKDNEKISMMIV